MRLAPQDPGNTDMEISGQSTFIPIDTVPRASPDTDGQSTALKAGPMLLLGGTVYATAYVVMGTTGVSSWAALLAIGATVLTLLGLKFVARRSD